MGFNTALVVDDSKLARVTLRKKLQGYGLQVELVESANQALEVLPQIKPDIIFMDHLMPEVDGFEATQKIRSMDEFRNTPIIMCTGKEHDGYLQEAQSIGANDILSKPPVDEALKNILETDFSEMDIPVAAVVDTEIPAEPEIAIPEAVVEEIEVPVAPEIVDQTQEQPVAVVAGLDRAEVEGLCKTLMEKEMSSMMEDVRYLVDSQTSTEPTETGLSEGEVAAIVNRVLDEQKSSIVSEVQGSIVLPEGEAPAAGLDEASVNGLIDMAFSSRIEEVKTSLTTSFTEQISQAVEGLSAGNDNHDISELLDLRLNAVIAERFAEVDKKIAAMEERVSEQLEVFRESTDALMGVGDLSLESGSKNNFATGSIERQIDSIMEEHEALNKKVHQPKLLAIIAIAVSVLALGAAAASFVL